MDDCALGSIGGGIERASDRVTDHLRDSVGERGRCENVGEAFECSSQCDVYECRRRKRPLADRSASGGQCLHIHAQSLQYAATPLPPYNSHGDAAQPPQSYPRLLSSLLSII